MAELDDFGGLLDWSKLQAWIDANDLPGSGPVTSVTKLLGGSQNNIFLMERGGASMVLRRPPQHLRANSNDTMLREARVLKALRGSDVPCPEFYGVCADESVIGACFYVMSPIDGFGPSGELTGEYLANASWRRSMAEELIGAAAKLSKVDVNAVGLGDFGKPDRWAERQVGRWRSQLDGYSALDGYDGPTELPHVDEVGDWLAANLPTDSRTGLIHGDFQWANVMFSRREPKLVGIVDWELSTLGDPMLDLGWVLTSWGEPGDPPDHNMQVNPWIDFPTRAELVELYGKLTGRSTESVKWFFVLACYKLGVILEGSWARALSGQADPEMGKRLHDTSVWLFRKGGQLVNGQDPTFG